MTLDRVVFATGDRLLARELADADAREATLHAIHVRAVHRTWGVALGFSVAASADHRAVLVGPGLAYDPCGRALVLAQPARAPLPPGAADGDYRLAASASLAGGDPRWCWLDRERATATVPVARVAVSAGLVTGDPQPAGRPVAAALAHVAAGRLTVQTEDPLISVAVDTSRAGFVETPCYFAQPAGPQEGLGYQAGAPEPLLEIRNEHAGGFMLDVRRFGTLQKMIAVAVAWIGIETHVPAIPIPTEERTALWCA